MKKEENFELYLTVQCRIEENKYPSYITKYKKIRQFENNKFQTTKMCLYKFLRFFT